MKSDYSPVSIKEAGLGQRTGTCPDLLRQLSRAVEQSPVSIVITDTEGSIKYVNPWFEKVTGYTAAEAVGLNPRVLKSGMQPPEFYRELWSTISSGRDWTGELHNRRKSGELFWERAVISPLRDDEGQIVSYVAVKEDVTAAKLAELELIAARDEAERANRAKSVFLAKMSHELRTPLNVINGVAATLLDQDLPAETRALVALMAQGGASLLGIIEEILVYAKIQAGQERAEDQLIDFAGVVGRALDLVTETTRGRPVELRFQLSADVPASFRADERRLQQVLVNLLANAAKFTEHGSVDMHVRAPLSNGRRVLEVDIVDTGIGIRPEVVPLLFQPFQQGDESTTRRHAGTGLGLAISRSFMQLMQGDIALRSEYGVGSTFTVSLPLREPSGRLAEALHVRPAVMDRPVAWVSAIEAPAQLAAAPVTQTARSLGQRMPLRILAADDVATNRHVLRIIFKHLGYTPVIVENGAQVLEAMAERSFDVVLLDLQMPLMDGLTAAREIRRKFPIPAIGPRIIALTANASEEDRRACFDSGMDEFLTKPVVPKQVEVCFLRLFRPLGPGNALPQTSDRTDPAGDAPWVDREHLAAISEGCGADQAAEMVLQLAATFGADFTTTLPRLETACAARDTAAAVEAIHGLKGGAAMLGWARFGAFCGCVLTELRTGRFENWNSLPQSLCAMHHRSAALLNDIFAQEQVAESEPEIVPS